MSEIAKKHFNEIDINTLKKELKNNKIPVRL